MRLGPVYFITDPDAPASVPDQVRAAVAAGIAHVAVSEVEVVDRAVSMVDPYVGKDRTVASIHKSMIHNDTLALLGVEPKRR